MPYTIAGERLADHLSFYYPTDLFAGGRACLDLRLQACPVPAVAAEQSAEQGAARTCASRRRFADPPARRAAWRARASPSAAAASASGGRAGGWSRSSTCAGAAARTVVVRSVARTRGGRVVRETRRYRTCA